MKKYVTLILLLLCFMLLGCEKPEEPVDDTPVVDDTQAPETVTPNEVVTPSEVEPEVVTPNEPEVTTEPEQHAEEPEENVIEISIDYKNDFHENIRKELEEFYSNPNNYSTVTPDKFCWGEYLPVVMYCSNTINTHTNIMETALLSSNAVTISEANELYGSLTESVKKAIRKNNTYYDPYIEINGEKYEIAISDIEDKITIDILDFIDDKCIIFSVFHNDLFYDCTYLYDIEAKTANRLTQYTCSDISLSPDRNYLVYSSPDSDNWLSDVDIPEGFYVKDLRTGDMVYYSCEGISPLGHSSYNIVGWLDSQEISS